MKTFQEFLEEGAWARIAARAYKSGRSFLKTGIKSGTKAPPLDIKMVGMPGSGKSTMAKKLAQRTGGTATGYDDARQTIHGNRSNQGKFPEVHALTMKRLKDAPQNKPRIQDNTNVNSKFKKSTDDALKKEAGFRNVTSVATDTSQKRSFSRNANREQPVPNFVMRSMASQERRFRNTKEGQKAIELGRELSKDYLLNRRSTRARLGVQNPKRGRFQEKNIREFQEFVYESGLARLALRGVKAASRVARTADGGRRVTSAARSAKNVKPRAVAPKGPPASKGQYDDALLNRREANSDLAAFKKAKFRANKQDIRSRFKTYGNTDPKVTSPDTDSFYSTTISKHKNQGTYAQRQVPRKFGYEYNAAGDYKKLARPTSGRAFFLKQLKKQMGGTRTPKQVADIEVGTKSDYYRKNDPEDLISRGKEFVQTLKNMPSTLYHANVKPGSKVTGHPGAVMPGETNKVMGREKRGKLYKKIAGSRMTKMNPVTQTLVGTMQ